MTEGVDQSVGRLVAKLDELGISDNTVIIFFSDNGGVPRLADNGELRSGKGFLWEGGVREPLIAKWPAEGPRLPADQRSELARLIDVAPTLIARAGAFSVANADHVVLPPAPTRGRSRSTRRPSATLTRACSPA